MYLESIVFTRALPCLAEPGKIIVVGKPARPLDDVLPFLATLPNIISYNPDARALTFRRAHGFLTVRSDQVSITQVRDTEEGLALLSALVDAINATWDHRAELVAVTAARRALRPLDIWTLLPQTNCKQCGEATCMAFAVALLQRQRDLSECPSLGTDAALADRRATLEAMLGIN
jgi:ArsR family metal-binding transcriptional regulator